MAKFGSTVYMLAVIVLLQACSGNSFHLRKNIDLPKSVQKIHVNNLSSNSKLLETFETALEEAGGEILEKAATQLTFKNVREGKRVVSYTSERKAREYLVFLKLDYEIAFAGAAKKQIYKSRINLDRSFIYDANFALGKAEEEREIQQDLRQEAARLIMLRLQYMEIR